jgi:autoinducer 2 (AI-2) kinase
MRWNMETAYIVIDIGTGNSRAGIASVDGRILSTVTVDSVYQRDHDFPDSVIFNPGDWFKKIKELIKKALAEAGPVEIIAVSSTSQREGIVLIDSAGESIVGYPNQDARGTEFMNEINWPVVNERTGLGRAHLYSCIKFLGTMKRQPDAAKKTAAYTSISDWIGFLFTGNLVWEHSQAMHSAVYDINAGNWSKELCDCIGVKIEKLPPLADAGTILGTVRKDLASELGINENTVFITAAADTQSALVGVGAELDDVVVVHGTTTPCTQVTASGGEFINKGCWLSPHAFKDRYMLEINAGYTGINLQVFREMLFPDRNLSELEQTGIKKGLPKAVIMFSLGLHLNEMPVMNGGILMKNPLDGTVSPADLVYALILNNVFCVYESLKRLQDLSSKGPGYIIGCGGGFRGPVTAQALADLTDKEIRLYEKFDQATTIGIVQICNRAMNKPAVKRRLVLSAKPTPNKALLKYYEMWKTMRGNIRQMNALYRNFL